jgi:hypothetical protein
MRRGRDGRPCVRREDRARGRDLALVEAERRQRAVIGEDAFATAATHRRPVDRRTWTASVGRERR